MIIIASCAGHSPGGAPGEPGCVFGGSGCPSRAGVVSATLCVALRSWHDGTCTCCAGSDCTRATSSIMHFVQVSTLPSSNTPIGPFQMIVRALAMAAAFLAIDSGVGGCVGGGGGGLRGRAASTASVCSPISGPSACWKGAVGARTHDTDSRARSAASFIIVSNKTKLEGTVVC